MNRKRIHLKFQNVLLRTMSDFMCIRLIGELKKDIVIKRMVEEG